MGKVRVTLTIDGAVLAETDEAAWLARLSRSAWVEARLRDGLAGRDAEAVAPTGQLLQAGQTELARPASSSEAKSDWKGGKP